MVPVCVSRLRRWRLASTASTFVSFVERYGSGTFHRPEAMCNMIGFLAALGLLLYYKDFISLGFSLYIHTCSAVCSKEESSGNLGLQRLRQSQSRWCLHIEVITLSSSFVFPFSVTITNLYFLFNSTASAVTVRSTIRRLREQTES